MNKDIPMNMERRDQPLGSLPANLSRRDLFAGLTGGLLMALSSVLGAEEAAAKKKRKKRKKHKQTPMPQTPATPATKADATCSGPSDTTTGGSNGDHRLAQTFTALASGPLVRVDLPGHKLAGSGGAYILRLSPVDGAGVPTNTILASASMPNLSVPDGNTTLTFTFADPASVVAGTQYALVLTRPNSNQMAWRGHVGDTCSGSHFYSLSQTAAFYESVTTLDLNFTTFVTS
jgi:hypothetical protein